MTAAFDLLVAATDDERAITVRLCDAAGRTLATNTTRLADHPASRFEGLFDLRRYVERYAGQLHPTGAEQPLSDHELVTDLSVFLGRRVLGTALLDALGTHSRPRTLRVRLPATPTDMGAALARVPWEFARRDERDSILAAKNVRVQAWPDDGRMTPAPAPMQPGEPLRVLLVFAAARGTTPLAARLEHRRLLSVFHRRVFPHGRVRVDALIHGVTGRRLERQIERAGGYHIVHWSGHGRVDRLALEPAEDEPHDEAYLTGHGLVRLFESAGQPPPRLAFLGACRSGDVGEIGDWRAFEETLAATRARTGRRRRETAPEALDAQMRRRPGYTGTAQALISAGVSSVVAMRYEVGDEYARELAVEFYTRLLGQERKTTVDEALNQARRAVQRRDRDAAAFDACDHATPVLYGLGDPHLALPAGSTPVPSLHPPLRVEALRPHAHFVGRTWELARLAAGWLDGPQRPVAVVRGLGGLGKTALGAEAVDAWHEHFRYVFPFDCRDGLSPDEFLRQLHAAWLALPSHYAERVTRFPAEAVWRPATEGFSGLEREAALGLNLREALRLESVLLVLDNFESNLIPAGPGAEWALREPAWQRVLRELSHSLGDTDSRLLLTTRRLPPGAADPEHVQDLLLGPLPPDEAALYVSTHDALRRSWFEQGEAGRAHVRRLLDVSRGHPLLLDRLARLDPFGLERALERVQQYGLASLPGFLASDPGQTREREYLEGALASSIDVLLEQAGPQARHALWVLSLAREPVAGALWRAVALRELPPGIDVMFTDAPTDDPGRRRTLKPSPSRKDTRANRDRERIRMATSAGWRTRVTVLVQLGLVQGVSGADAHEPGAYDCHELVRERIDRWVENQPDERAGRTPQQVWAAFGAYLIEAFRGLRDAGQLSLAVDVGRRALSYVVCSRSLGLLTAFASELLASTSDPSVLAQLLQDLERAAASAEPGPLRQDILTLAADALIGVGQAEASLVLYDAAAAEAQRAGAWGHLAWINGNWANALAQCGQLETAYIKHLEASEFKQRAGAAEIDVLGSRLEAWRIALLLGGAHSPVAQMELAIATIRGWWQRNMRGESVPEAPDADLLGRVYLSALDAMREVHASGRQWQAALDRVAEAVAVERARGAAEYEIARDRFNNYVPLLRLDRPDQALSELEHCLDVFEGARDSVAQAKTLSALADVFHHKNDLQQAVSLQRRALALVNALPDPEGRATSHHNLGLYLGLSGDHQGMSAHELAALLYMVASSHVQHVRHWADSHAQRTLQARREGWIHQLPQALDLLGQPDFASVAEWLATQQVDLAQLQQAVDTITALCRDAADGANPATTT